MPGINLDKAARLSIGGIEAARFSFGGCSWAKPAAGPINLLDLTIPPEGTRGDTFAVESIDPLILFRVTGSSARGFWPFQTVAGQAYRFTANVTVLERDGPVIGNFVRFRNGPDDNNPHVFPALGTLEGVDMVGDFTGSGAVIWIGPSVNRVARLRLNKYFLETV